MSLGPLLSWSFPNRPVVRARIAQADAQVQADLARFDGTVLEALRQTETALESYRRHADQTAALDRARDSAGISAAQAGKLFRFGRGDSDRKSTRLNSSPNCAYRMPSLARIK